jgi:hypothetical protein
MPQHRIAAQADGTGGWGHRRHDLHLSAIAAFLQLRGGHGHGLGRIGGSRAGAHQMLGWRRIGKRMIVT